MALTPGTRLGVYQVTAQIGEGGMGQVYRARDTKLDRDVAIKILPEAFAHDADRLARFQREAKTLASLNHPNIAIIYGLEQAGDVDALVMELVPGDDLSQRIVRGAIPLDEALPIAKQIAEALEAAHEQGIIHRDLKPANIKLRPDGTVKVLDFGLAKALDLAPASDLSQSPTITSPAMTGTGVILGTAAYMSPEQARGKSVDKRTDVWAFGCVLYEMLTGRVAFGEDTISDTIAAILGREPEWSALKTPASLRRVLQRCLEKDPRRRLHDIADARIEIEDVSGDIKAELQWIAEGGSLPGARAAATPRSRMGERLAWLVGAVGIVAALIVGVLHSLEAPAVAPLLRLSVPPPERASASHHTAISPDGRLMAFADNGSGSSNLLWIRPLDSLTAQALPGTEGAQYPFWSPDSRFIGFFAQEKLKKIEVGGSESGPPQTLCEAPAGRGGAWNRDGVILFSPNLEEAIYRVSAAGGAAMPVTMLDRSRRQSAHRWPDFLPDGGHFLYWVRSSDQEAQGIYVGSLDAGPDSQDKTRLLSTATNALYAAPGYLLFEEEGTLMARRFDARRLQFAGEPARVVSKLGSSVNNRVDFTVSANGLLAYASGGLELQLLWFDRAGEQVGSVGGSAGYQDPQLSPDGKQVALMRLDPQNAAGDIWVLELLRGTASRLTIDPSFDWKPMWSPDGQRLAFASNRKGAMSLYQRPAGAGQDELVLDSGSRITPTDWSQDGRSIVYQQVDPKTKEDLWVLPLEGDRKPIPFLRTEFDETEGRLSPDGRWMAYTSDESGTQEVYVQRFAGREDASASRVRVSTNGGSNARWRRDGRELFYISSALKLVAAGVRSASTFEVGPSQALFDVPGRFSPAQVYTATADGQRFLLSAPIGDTVPSPIIVIVNWTAALRR